MAEDNFAMGYALGQDSNGNNCNNGGGYGASGWAEMIFGIIILAMFGGWNGNGGLFGNRGNGGSAATQADIQRGFDTSNIIGKLDGINNGMCDGFYATNTGMLNGFNGVGNAICNLGYENAQLANATQMAIMQGNNAANIVALQNQNALQSLISQCCCDNREAISGLKYDMATNDCSIKTLLNQLFQQLQWGQQNGLRDLTDLINNKFCQLEMSQKDAVIADLRTQLAQCGDQNMANSIVARLSAVINPPAVPAYPACNPNGVGNWAPQVLNGGGFNGCGCGGCNSCGC